MSQAYNLPPLINVGTDRQTNPRSCHRLWSVYYLYIAHIPAVASVLGVTSQHFTSPTPTSHIVTPPLLLLSPPFEWDVIYGRPLWLFSSTVRVQTFTDAKLWKILKKCPILNTSNIMHPDSDTVLQNVTQTFLSQGAYLIKLKIWPVPFTWIC